MVTRFRERCVRVRTAAPFLRFDSDPYPLIYQGKIQWLYDGYTATSR